MSPQERKPRWRRIVLVLGIALVTLVGAAAAFVATRQEGDVSNPDVEFREEPSATPEPEVEPDERRRRRRPIRSTGFIWAHYGYTATAGATCRSSGRCARRSARSGSTRATCCSSSRR